VPVEQHLHPVGDLVARAGVEGLKDDLRERDARLIAELLVVPLGEDDLVLALVPLGFVPGLEGLPEL